MCMKHFDAEKILFDKLTQLAIFCQLHLKNGW